MKYLVSALTERFKHPIMASVLMSAVVFFLIGAVLQVAPIPGVPPIVAGFFGIYGVLAATLGLFGYGVLYVVKAISVAGDRAAPHNT